MRKSDHKGDSAAVLFTFFFPVVFVLLFLLWLIAVTDFMYIQTEHEEQQHITEILNTTREYEELVSITYSSIAFDTFTVILKCPKSLAIHN